MKKFFVFIILCALLVLTYLYRENIIIFLVDKLSITDKEVKLDFKNKYYLDYKVNYVKVTDNFQVENKNDLLNVYYTIINSGIDEFSFYCPDTYSSCIDDVLYLSSDEATLSNINSFVHPYNSFNAIKTEYNSFNKVTLSIDRTYDDDKIKAINDVVKRIIDEEVKDEDDPKEIIKIIHNYIINNTKYDIERADNNIIKYESSNAYGVLIEHYGLCGGYTDAMAIFLNYYNIPNFKVVSSNHIWNAVYIDNNWYHLDLTWDDPVIVDGSDTLEYTFFLISTAELENLETNQHIFDHQVFSELN